MSATRRLALLIEYNGMAFSGWQVQNNAHTVQAEVESAFFKLSGQEYTVVGSGRTDAGVHASGQVAHVDVAALFSIPIEKVRVALNSRLNNDVRILDAVEVSSEFHARFSPVAREYSFLISEFQSTAFHNRVWQLGRTLDFVAMQQAASVFEGEHNFTSFSKLNHDTANYVCDVYKCQVLTIRPGVYRVCIQADRFVYAMVRSIVAAIVEAGIGKRTSTELSEALAAQDRRLNAAVAPPHGLTLFRVQYPVDVFASWYTDNDIMNSHVIA